MEILVFLTVACFVAVVWFSAARRSAVLESVDDDGLKLKNLLGAHVLVCWSDVVGPVRLFRRFLPRVTFHVKSRRFSVFTIGYSVFLRGRYGEAEMVQHLESTIGINVEHG